MSVRAALARMRRRPARLVASVAAWGFVLAAVMVVVAPFWERTDTFGFHDWDVETSFRWLVASSLRDHGELPWFNPYACGGYPSWGYVEGATVLVSPWLPVYLSWPIEIGIRVEATGMALLGAAGAFAWAAQLTKSQAARLFVVALWAVNGRWGLQTASGHVWHLAYAYLPWCGFFFERALASRRLRHLVGMGVGFALLVYAGGIYPLPHTVVALGLYALGRSVLERNARPLAMLSVGGAIGVGLAAPKLLPMLHTFAAHPRLIDSSESLALGDLVTLLTSRTQGFYDRPAPVQPYGWHEWGMYVGWAGLGLLLLGLVLVRARRARAAAMAGGSLALLGLGAFHPLAPWPLLHAHVPFFGSQHVPSRWLYPAMLLLALAAATGLGRLVRSRQIDLVLVMLVGLLALDVASVAQEPMRQAMWMQAPPIEPRSAFAFAVEPPIHYLRRDWAGPMLLSMMANTGVLDCYGVPRDGPWKARAESDPDYRGMVDLVRPEPDGAEQIGEAEIVAWSPNAVTVRVTNAAPGSLLVYNMHHWPGWQSDAGEVRAHAGLVAVPVPGDGLVRLRYRPPGLARGLACAGLTLLSLLFFWRWRRG